MSTFKKFTRVTKGALLFSALLTGVAATSMSAQQAAVQATTATPAPAASPLFAQADEHATTIAAAQADNKAAMMHDSTTIGVSTLALVLIIVILVLLIT